MAAILAGPSMPLGSTHDETGLLLRDGHVLILQRDDGGRWRLDTSRRTEELVGCRVRVRGRRGDFDILEVQQIQLV